MITNLLTSNLLVINRKTLAENGPKPTVVQKGLCKARTDSRGMAGGINTQWQETRLIFLRGKVSVFHKQI